MKYPYSSHRISEMVAAPKCLRENETFEVMRRGSKGGAFDARLDLLDGPFVDLRYLGKTHDFNDVTSSEASLLLDAYRVRGVGFNNVGRRRFYKDRISPGWHQNVLDPNLSTGDENNNRHIPLPDFTPVDFDDFVRKTSALWSIDLSLEERLL